jgi:PIN domain nuclease of toxin-antitoxin system
VSYLLDTHVFLWAVMQPRRLSSKVRHLLENDETELVVSAATAWEIATKFRLGKLPDAGAVVADYAGTLRQLRSHELPLTSAHALLASRYTVPHRDPFDRMLAAQTEYEQLTLISRDPVFREQFGIRTLW